jgi:hypothetical protein
MKLYVLKNPDPQTIATCQEVADDAPTPASPWELMSIADFAAWKAVQPVPAQPVPLLRQDTLTVLNRLTDTESQALHNAQQSDYRVWKFVQMAGTGVIDQADPNYSAAVQLLDSLGIIAAARWPTLLAP